MVRPAKQIRYFLSVAIVMVAALVMQAPAIASDAIQQYKQAIFNNSEFRDVDFQSYSSLLIQLLDDEFQAVVSEVSQLIRQNRRKAYPQHQAKAISRQALSNWPQERYGHFLMVLCYDLMSFADFQAVFDLLDPQILTISAWSSSTITGKTAKANLLHIYGQILVRKKRVAEALDFFFEAEAIFKELDSQHPSIFTIQVILSEAYIEAENYREALSYLRLAQELFPVTRLDGRSYVAGLYAKATMEVGEIAQAHDIIHQYLQNPVDPREDYFLFFSLIHLDILQRLDAVDEYGELATATYQLAEKIDNNDYLNEARMHLGRVQLNRGNVDFAIVLFKNTIADESEINDDAVLNAYLWLAEAYEKRREFDQALKFQIQYTDLFKQKQEKLNQAAIAEVSARYQIEHARILAEGAQVSLSLTREKEKTTRLVMYCLMASSLVLILAVWITSVSLVKLRVKNKMLAELSTKDALTQIGNRLAMTRDTTDNPPLCVALADIDYLKYYNDKYGHEEGDRLIQAFVQALKERLDLDYTHLYRIGGDEFVITSDRDIKSLLEVIFISVESNMKELGFDMAGVSFGVATCEEAEAFGKQLSLADLRMYQCKAEKRKRHEPN